MSWSWITMKLISKKAWGRRKEHVSKRGNWLIYHLKNMSHQKIYTFWYHALNDKVPSTSSQIVEQIEFIPEVVLLGISKLNDAAPGKKQGDQTQFSPEIL